MKKVNSILLITIFFSIALFTNAAQSASNHATSSKIFESELAKLEDRFDAKIGVAGVDFTNRNTVTYRANQRFFMGCTSKVVGVAAMLKKSMSEPLLLSKKINLTREDLLSWSPITSVYVDQGLTIRQLCASAIILSDNTAMNLLAVQLGGLDKINQFANSLGDKKIRLDRYWPAEAKAENLNDLRDTTTPSAMLATLEKLIFSDVLAPYQRAELINWMKSNIASENRMRGGVPKNTIVADKTGAGFTYGFSNDIGVIWVPHCKPIVLAIYTRSNQKNAASLANLIASITKLVITEFARHNQCLRGR